MQFLKGLVIGMGALIVVGVGLLVYGIYRKATNSDTPFFTMSTTTTTAESAKRFGEVPLALPPGCSLAELRPDGGRLYVRTGPAGGDCEGILVLDSADGSLIGSIAVKR